MDRAQLKERAKFALKNNYWKIVLVTLIVFLIGGGSTTFGIKVEYDDLQAAFAMLMPSIGMLGLVSIALIGFVIAASVIGILVSVFIFAPLEVGTKRFFVNSLSHPAETSEVSFGFERNYKNVVKILFFRNLYVFGWSLLFIIPGIIKGYEYYMVPYLLAENPDLTKEEVFELSKQMMTGKKCEAFVLELSFLGWDILSSFTWGILGIFFVEPYRNLTKAAFYEEISMIHGRPASAFGQSYQEFRNANPFGYDEI